MILKLLLVLGVILIIYFLFIKKKPLHNNKKTSSESQKEESDEMVECSSCATYAPLRESILSNGKYFCSDECIKG